MFTQPSFGVYSLKNVQKEEITEGGGCEHLSDVVHHGDLEFHVHERLVRVGDAVVEDMLGGNKETRFSCLVTSSLTTSL